MNQPPPNSPTIPALPLFPARTLMPELPLFPLFPLLPVMKGPFLHPVRMVRPATAPSFRETVRRHADGHAWGEGTPPGHTTTRRRYYDSSPGTPAALEIP